MKAVLGRIRRLLTGTDEWIQERRWLRGGPHHATVTYTVMVIGAIWGAPMAAALPALGFYGFQMVEEQNPDSVTDFFFPLGTVLLWLLSGPITALAALAVATLAWWTFTAVPFDL